MSSKHIDHRDLSSLFLRVGLAIVFMYAAYSSLVQPAAWIMYLPHFLTDKLEPALEIKMFAVYEALLAIWLLSRRGIKYSASLAALTFSTIIVFNLYELIVTFRDVGLLFASISLILLEA